MCTYEAFYFAPQFPTIPCVYQFVISAFPLSSITTNKDVSRVIENQLSGNEIEIFVSIGTNTRD